MFPPQVAMSRSGHPRLGAGVGPGHPRTPQDTWATPGPTTCSTVGFPPFRCPLQYPVRLFSEGHIEFRSVEWADPEPTEESFSLYY